MLLPVGVAKMEFDTKRLAGDRDDIAPDGCDVRILLRLDGGSMAHFELAPGSTSIAVAHRTVDEIWYVLHARGEMWRKQGERQEVVPMEPGVCLSIPVGTRFQFRSFGYEALAAISVTMPPWPGPGESYEVDGIWRRGQ
jgi:mannose-6-phosphate isomerase-like protein (cupin superfamily)